jgi:hypothetical protein
VNDVGKPGAGEPHARFEAAGTGNGASATAPVPDPTKAAQGVSGSYQLQLQYAVRPGSERTCGVLGGELGSRRKIRPGKAWPH